MKHVLGLLVLRNLTHPHNRVTVCITRQFANGRPTLSKKANQDTSTCLFCISTQGVVLSRAIFRIAFCNCGFTNKLVDEKAK